MDWDQSQLHNLFLFISYGSLYSYLKWNEKNFWSSNFDGGFVKVCSHSASFLTYLLLYFSQSIDLLRVSREGPTLMSVRDNLIRQEDTIVLSLIERAKYPRNSNAYSESYLSEMGVLSESPSLISLFVKESEALNAKVWIATINQLANRD